MAAPALSNTIGVAAAMGAGGPSRLRPQTLCVSPKWKVPMSGLLPHNPADGVVLQLDVLRIPQIGEHVARRHIADATLTVVVRPASRSRGAVALISETVFVHGLQEEKLGVLVVAHVVLLVGDHEVPDALRNRMIGIRDRKST